MENCKLCGEMYEPIQFPIELPDITLFDHTFKAPHKIVCPRCFRKNLKEIIITGTEIMYLLADVYEKKKKRK